MSFIERISKSKFQICYYHHRILWCPTTDRQVLSNCYNSINEFIAWELLLGLISFMKLSRNERKNSCFPISIGDRTLFQLPAISVAIILNVLNPLSNEMLYNLSIHKKIMNLIPAMLVDQWRKYHISYIMNNIFGMMDNNNKRKMPGTSEAH